MTRAGADRLLAALEAEADAERREILGNASKTADRIREEARVEAERIEAREAPAGIVLPEDPRLAAARERLLEAYHGRVTQLRQGVAARVAALEEGDRRRMLVGVLAGVLAHLPPGTYRVAARPGLCNAIESFPGRPRGRVLRLELRTPGAGDGADEIVVEREDGNLRAAFSPRTLVERHFLEERARVARLLIGHGSS